MKKYHKFNHFESWCKKAKELGYRTWSVFGQTRFADNWAYTKDDEKVGFWNANVTVDSGWIEELCNE